jgi:hypothetical protein
MLGHHASTNRLPGFRAQSYLLLIKERAKALKTKDPATKPAASVDRHRGGQNTRPRKLFQVKSNAMRRAFCASAGTFLDAAAQRGIETVPTAQTIGSSGDTPSIQETHR